MVTSLVCWSGGCDSTLILNDLLSKRTSPVITYSISHSQVAASKVEKKHRIKLKKKLESKYGKFESYEVDVSQQINDGLFGQALLWLMSSQLFLTNEQDLYMGYIREDDIWHEMHHIQSVFSALQKISGKQGKLYTPLEWYHKTDVIKHLEPSGLLPLVRYCEENSAAPCKKCTSCIRHDAALYSIGVNK